MKNYKKLRNPARIAKHEPFGWFFPSASRSEWKITRNRKERWKFKKSKKGKANKTWRGSSDFSLFITNIFHSFLQTANCANPPAYFSLNPRSLLCLIDFSLSLCSGKNAEKGFEAKGKKSSSSKLKMKIKLSPHTTTDDSSHSFDCAVNHRSVIFLNGWWSFRISQFSWKTFLWRCLHQLDTLSHS